ncbi:MAG: Fe-S protein assembly co-chaperone HscB [Gammaproteobacteria bacterium]|nr:Fe-S protein assembly co-chaperone HscB [Gammaproteobacteria bacterium]
MPAREQQNYFQLFDLAPGFSIDRDAVERKYRKLQALLHPDRHAASGGQQQRIALRQSALVNEAYGVLMDDCARAGHLLQLQGIELNDETDTTGDAGFLAEQMEFRERLQELDGHDDPREAEAEAAQLSAQVAARAAQVRDGFSNAWQSGDLEAAREYLLKMKFIGKLTAGISDAVAGLRAEN